MYNPQHAGTKHSPTFEEGRHAARVAYAEIEGHGHNARGWAMERVQTEGLTDYSRGFIEGLRESIRETDEARRAGRPTCGRITVTVYPETAVPDGLDRLRALGFQAQRTTEQRSEVKLDPEPLAALHPDVLRHIGALQNLGSQLLAAQPDLRSITISVELDLPGGGS